MQPHFLTVKVKCKPLVKAYLESNFGNPVTIPPEHIIYKTASAQLAKNNTRENDSKEYTTEVSFGISQTSFNYDGWEIKGANTRLFNVAVDNYIRNLIRTNLDSLLSLQKQQEKWKEKYKELLNVLGKEAKERVTKASVKKLKDEVDQHEFCIKTAINHVVINTLKLNFDVLPYETIKKDYYRYRIKISNGNVPQPIKT